MARFNSSTPTVAKRQSARMSKITIDGLTRSGTECIMAVPIYLGTAIMGVKGIKLRTFSQFFVASHQRNTCVCVCVVLVAVL